MSLVQYAVADRVATVAMDDGKVNALSPAMQAEIGDALDRAEKDDVAAVVLAGRGGRFSGGFDLEVLRAGGPDADGMVRGGFVLAERLLSFPRPVVVACTGHAIAMGSFLVLSGDYRVGAEGEFKIQAIEVAIGMTLPYAAIAIMRHRLNPSAFDRAAGLAAVFNPSEAVTAGWLDELAPPDAVVPTAQARAASFAALDATAHAASKRRTRAPVLADIRRALESGNL